MVKALAVLAELLAVAEESQLRHLAEPVEQDFLLAVRHQLAQVTAVVEEEAY
jgi:hypothetical protein